MLKFTLVPHPSPAIPLRKSDGEDREIEAGYETLEQGTHTFVASKKCSAHAMRARPSHIFCFYDARGFY
jgi:hypothetical protein